MNTKQHNVNRDMIHLYFLGILHPDDCRHVENAVRNDDELMKYFKRQLALAELTDQIDLEPNPEKVQLQTSIYPMIYHARSESVALAANHISASNTRGNVTGRRDQSEPYAFTWTEIPSEDVILLTFVDNSGHIESAQELLLDVSFTYELKDSGEEFELRVGVVKLLHKSSRTWIGQFGPAGFGVEIRNSIITTLKGVRV